MGAGQEVGEKVRPGLKGLDTAKWDGRKGKDLLSLPPGRLPVPW
jgi:hypothetical protein